MSAITEYQSESSNCIAEQVNRYTEKGFEVVSKSKKGAGEAIEGVIKQVHNYAETGRETITNATTKAQNVFEATKQKAQVVASEGKRQMGDFIDSATACVKGDHDTENYDGSETPYMRMRNVAEQCLEKGKQVVGDAKTSAEAYQQAVCNTVSQGCQCVDAYTSAAKSSVEPIVDTAKHIADKSTKCLVGTCDKVKQRATSCVATAESLYTKASTAVDKSKPRLVAISSSGKKAFGERDVNLFIITITQIVAFLLLVMNGVFKELCKVKFVRDGVAYAKDTSLGKYVQQTLNCDCLIDKIECLPVIGPCLANAMNIVAWEVKKG